ncbi:MAG TPA: hypothetical protein VMB35_04285, partial [Methanomicrobiales archaeon]|nr:hypothetical protein [Methanomicrobiales archaeon]
HGEILPSTPVTVPRGGSQTFYIISDPGYLIKDVAVDGTSVGSVPSYTFTNVQDDHKIKATYKQTKQTFTIIPSAGSHGTISPSTPVMVPYAGSQTFTITPDSGYAVDRVLVNGQSVGSVTSYSFSSVLADQTISATFKQLAPRTTNCFGDRIDNGEAPFRFEYTGPGVPPEYEGGPHWIWYTERCANSYATVAPEYAHPGTAANGVRIGCQNAESGGWKYGYTQMYQGGEYPGFDPEWAIYIPPGAKISFWYKTMMTGSDSGYDVTRIEYYGTRTYPSTLLVSAASKGWTYGEFSLPPASETLWEVNFVAMASNGHSTELWLSNIYAECPVGVEGTAQYQGIQTSSAISPSSWRALNGTEAPV